MAGLYVIAALLLLGVAVGVALRPIRPPGPVSTSEAWLTAARHARRVATVAWTVLLGTQLLVMVGASTMVRGFGFGLVPAASGIAFLAVLAAGELTWPRPTGAVRRAPLARRGLHALAPAGLVRLVAVWTTALGALLVLCGAAAADDGRSLTWQLSASATSGAGPFPGWYYGVPLGLGAIAVLAGGVGVLVLIARRPAVSDAAPGDDTALRRLSARRLLGGVQLVLAWTLAGCLFYAADALRRTQEGSFDGVDLGSPALVTVAVIGMCAAPAVVIVSAVVAWRSAGAPRRHAGSVDQHSDAHSQPQTA
ncbi:hypothetical protein HP550_12315 [Cellulomonas humilata]|uniref:Uncharacterized protein n=1 Tax=Cellulomonas humilata TaxID=144055 RepID=A0A7Y6A3J7_9CELL|nr:hypothetical protein [Cellulomonas humilata]NUU18032.1 hypothetical protein [Cellulomonas humilata]